MDVIDGRGQIVPVRYLIRTDKTKVPNGCGSGFGRARGLPRSLRYAPGCAGALQSAMTRKRRVVFRSSAPVGMTEKAKPAGGGESCVDGIAISRVSPSSGRVRQWAHGVSEGPRD